MQTSSTSSQEVVLHPERYDSPAATTLIVKANSVNEELYGHPDQTPVSPDEFAPEQGGGFVVAFVDDVPVGCGGYRRHVGDPTGATAEIKRMYVEPDLRRSGIASQVLGHLEEGARRAGYRAAILDTGSKQVAAHALYEACGYRRTTGFSMYKDRPGNRAYRKELPHAATGEPGSRLLAEPPQ
ncbi:GNAT family N-acetyltransferase [Nocardia mexicana]|uniref:GNAT family N-acetyltransferase n=1 Tax=Nocardia mexicana TaxID=279262 RepID=UPI0009FD6A81